ncbi:vanin-like protein 1 [Dendroctonus ponderosae]|uniref:vanin-like protein 1 n=1 Tax=Dendroctonus ponderosae TaxID=77166 RepID=UPI0020353303|nr:vanin-like protein 1 [Dendroctonus ponderosae]
MNIQGLIFVLAAFCCKFSTAEFYNVAIMEYAINTNFSQPSESILQENTRNYLDLIGDLVKNHSDPALDLIIFPESTLSPSQTISTTSAQLPADQEVLCNSNGSYLEFLKDISCASINYNTTIIINFTEKEICQAGEGECPETGEIFYNTNIALGTEGTIIGRYRKWNLFGEYAKSKPASLDLPVFSIKNTSFGMMTCFDIQFGVPAFNLTRDKRVENVIFPLYWISELPYLTALQVEQMWAQEFDVVLLASGASLPRTGAGGSGIFLGKEGTLQSEILPESGTRVLVHRVPTDKSRFQTPYEETNSTITDELALDLDDFYMLVDPSIREHNSVILNTSQERVETTVCHGEDSNALCCDFNVSLFLNAVDESLSVYTYHLVAFNGIRTFSGLYYGGVETCGIVACLNQSVESCGQRFPNYSQIAWPVTFSSITVLGKFAHSAQRVEYPTTLLSSIRPLPVKEYTWTSQTGAGIVEKNITLLKPQNRLLAFGIFGRDYERDWDPIRSPPSSDSITCSVTLSIFPLLIVVLLNLRFRYG